MVGRLRALVCAVWLATGVAARVLLILAAALFLLLLRAALNVLAFNARVLTSRLPWGIKRELIGEYNRAVARRVLELGSLGPVSVGALLGAMRKRPDLPPQEPHRHREQRGRGGAQGGQRPEG